MQNLKKMHACNAAAGAELEENGPFAASNIDLFWKFIYTTIFCNNTPL